MKTKKSLLLNFFSLEQYDKQLAYLKPPFFTIISFSRQMLVEHQAFFNNNMLAS